VFITVLTGELRSQEELDGLFEVMDLVDRQQATVITSSLVRSEVLDDLTDPTIRQRLNDLFRRPSFVTIDVNAAISDKAAALRAACRTTGRGLKSPDAVFIATALFHGADAMHTFDDKLLSLSGRTEVDGLTICKLHGVQTILEL
jgi:predicted nucleic acid-binding protein